MKNLILISDEKYHQFDTIDELKSFIIPNLIELSEEDIEKYMYEKVFGFSIMNNLQIIKTTKGVYGGNYEIIDEDRDYTRAIIIDNLDTYILSLCKYKIITLLEEKDNRNYTNEMDIKLDDENYIVVNEFANEILLGMVGDVK